MTLAAPRPGNSVFPSHGPSPQTAPYCGSTGSDRKWREGALGTEPCWGSPVGQGGACSPLGEVPIGCAPGEKGNKEQLALPIGINPTIRKIASIAKKRWWKSPFIFHFSRALATLMHESLSVCRLNLCPRYLSCLWGQLGFWLLKAPVCFVGVRAALWERPLEGKGVPALSWTPLSPPPARVSAPLVCPQDRTCFLENSSSSLELLLLQRLQ